MYNYKSVVNPYRGVYPRPSYYSRFNIASGRNYPRLFRLAGVKTYPRGNVRPYPRQRIERVVRKMAEKKYHDTFIDYNPTLAPLFYPSRSSPQIINLTQVVDGSTVTSRVGNRITGTSLEVRMQISSADNVGTDYRFRFRIIIFIWKDTLAPVINDILQNANWPQVIVSPLTHDRKKRRKILYDYTDERQQPAAPNIAVAPVEGDLGYCIKRVILNLSKFKDYNKVIEYQGSNSTIGTNQIFMLTVTSNVASLTGWNMRTYTRYNFIDM